MFQHDNTSVHKSTAKTWFSKDGGEELISLEGALTSTPLNSFGTNWNVNLCLNDYKLLEP